MAGADAGSLGTGIGPSGPRGGHDHLPGVFPRDSVQSLSLSPSRNLPDQRGKRLLLLWKAGAGAFRALGRDVRQPPSAGPVDQDIAWSDLLFSTGFEDRVVVRPPRERDVELRMPRPIAGLTFIAGCGHTHHLLCGGTPAVTSDNWDRGKGREIDGKGRRGGPSFDSVSYSPT